MNKIKVLTVFGTRPEVIKLAPFIKAVEDDSEFISVTCATTQQRELQNEALNLFNIKPNYNLDIMLENQDLSYVSCSVLNGVTKILIQEKPDFVVVQGDTATAFTSALAAFYKKIPVVHIEAGLRTGNIFSPFPEEANRILISKIATLHMAPTKHAKENLSKEGVINNVFMVGNTIVDSVHWAINNFTVQNESVNQIINNKKRKTLITVHRRENFGKPLEEICLAIKDLCILYPDHYFIWPVHPNPNVHSIVHSHLNNVSNLILIDPLPYNDLLIVINRCDFLISDSGGIQEEAAILGKKIIVLREETERMEIIDAGIGILAGSNKDKIIEECCNLLNCINVSSINLNSIYGSPGVSKLILKEIKSFYQECH